jgi:hypothetical protein
LLANPDCVHGLFLVICNKSGSFGRPTNPDFFAVQFFFVLLQIFYVFPCGVNPVGDNCMMTKASSWRSRLRNGGLLGLCWIDDGHCSPLSLLLLSLFGVLIAFVTTGGIVAVWCHCCHCCHCHRCCHRCCCCHRCYHCRHPF